MKPTLLNTILIAGLASVGSLAIADSSYTGETAYALDLASWTVAQQTAYAGTQDNAFIARDLASWTVAQQNAHAGIQDNTFIVRDLASWTGVPPSQIPGENTFYARDRALWKQNGSQTG